MKLSKFKTELSKLSGVDFHNPKYRDVFKRYFDADDTEEKDEENADAETTAETVSTPVAETTEAPKATEDEPDSDKPADEPQKPDEGGEDAEKPDAEQKPVEQTAADTDADSESDVDKSTSEDASDPEEVATEAEASEQTAADISDELLHTKLELELVRAGIREDRLETAKRLFMPEFKASGGNSDQIRELIAQYPEWLGKQGGGAQGFGMPLGDKADALTAEEKALKRMGIDPRQ